MASAGNFIVALILMLIIVSSVVYALAKFVARDSFWYDSEFVWRRNLQKEGTACDPMDKEQNHPDQ